MSGFAIFALVAVFVGFLFLSDEAPATLAIVGAFAVLGVGGYIMFTKGRS